MLEFMGGQGLTGGNAAADRNWMLLASALGRRFSDRQLQNDPRLQRVVADARWAASSIDRYYHAGLTFSDGFSDQLPGTVQ